VLSASIQ